MIPDPIIYALTAGVFGAGAAWGAVKTGLNGTKAKVSNMETALDAHIKEEHDNDMKTHERIARVETKVDLLVERFIE